MKYNVKRLFKEDSLVSTNLEHQKLIEGEVITEEDLKGHYQESEVFERFKNLAKSEINADEFETEEAKREKFPNHGMEIWGIGYVTSDHSQDDDEDADEEENGEDSAYNEELRMRILKGPEVEFDMDEFENIGNNARLREIYSYRWWSDSDPDNYFIMVNKSFKDIKKGD